MKPIFLNFLTSRIWAPNINNIIAHISSDQKSTCIFIKNIYSRYQFANKNFIDLMGLSSFQQLLNSTDDMLCDNPSLTRKYKDDDQYVIEETKVLESSEQVMPKFNKPIIKQMQGALYPIYQDDNKPAYILGVFTPVCKLLKLDWDTIFKLNHNELAELLTRKKYKLTLTWGQVKLSKRDIQLIIELMKGLTAGEIANRLKLKQTTIESYLDHLKNKLGVTSKSELINLIISNNLLQQILI